MSHSVHYPRDCIQYMAGSWWEKANTSELCRGKLVWAFVPYVDQQPRILHLEGRIDPTHHGRVNYRIVAASGTPYNQDLVTLPVAAFPQFDNERLLVSRAKRRPALVISGIGTEVSRKLSVGKSKHLTSSTVIVAPFFGALQSSQRAGFSPELVVRIRKAEYSQFFWDKLPLGGDTDESILRFNHVLPIGNHYSAYEDTQWVLSEEALEIVNDWLMWFITGEINEDGMLYYIREELIKEAGTDF